MPHEKTTSYKGWLCVIPNHWGRGATPAEARKNAKKARGGSRPLGDYVLLGLPSAPSRYWLNEMGGLVTKLHAGKPPGEPVIEERRHKGKILRGEAARAFKPA